MNNFFKNFFYFIKNLNKLSFDIPNRRSTIIFDHYNETYLKKYIKNKDIFTINFREKIYFFATLYSIIFFFRSNLKTEYLNFFIKISNSKLFLSQNYRRLSLYNLKKYNNNTNFIFIQNENYTNEFLLKLKKAKNYYNLKCDYFFCFSELDKKILSKYINANFKILGSLKNNFFKINKYKKSNLVLFISQYRKNLINDKRFKWLYDNEIELLKNLSEYCKYKNLRLYILPGEENLKEQRNYYSKFIDKKLFNLYNKNIYKSYLRLDKSIFSTGIDSTLVYEAISRGVSCLPICYFKKKDISNMFQLSNYHKEAKSIFRVKKPKKIDYYKLFDCLKKRNSKKMNNLKKKFNFMSFNKNNVLLSNVIKTSYK